MHYGAQLKLWHRVRTLHLVEIWGEWGPLLSSHKYTAGKNEQQVQVTSLSPRQPRARSAADALFHCS